MCLLLGCPRPEDPAVVGEADASTGESDATDATRDGDTTTANTDSDTTTSTSGLTAPGTISTSAGPSTAGTISTSADPSTAGSTVQTDSADPTTDGDTDATDGESSTTGGIDTPGTGGLLEDGNQCTVNDECASGMCYVAGILGGICGACLDEDDCMWGCTAPDFLSTPTQGATCGDGMIGAGCDTNAGCAASLECAGILDIPGVISVRTCSECTTDADCAGQLCSPVVELEILSGHRECVDAGSVPDAGFCDLDSSGDEACANHCGEADIGGLVSLGVCGECSNHALDNEGCQVGETCQDPTVDLDGAVTPGACV